MTRRSRGLSLELALCGLVAGLTGLVYARFYAGWRAVPVILAAAALPVPLVLACVRRTWPPARAALVAAAGLALFTVLAVYWGTTSAGLPVPAAWAALGRGLVDGWAQMLSVGLPADPAGDLLVTPVVLTGAAAAAAAVLAVRTSSPLAPLAPPALAFVAALALVAAAGPPHPLVTAAVLAAGLLLVLVRAGRLAAAGVELARAGGGPPGPDVDGDAAVAVEDGADASAAPPPGDGRRRPRRLGPLAFGAPVVVALAVTGTLLAGALPLAAGDRFDPRELRDVRLDIDESLSPLVELKSQLGAETPDALFTLEATGLPEGVDRVRVAALEAYDGAHWTTAAEYRLAGAELAEDPLAVGEPQPTATVRQRVTVTGLDGPFLPVVGRPVTVDARSPVGYDPASGTLVRTGPPTRSISYDVVSEVGALSLVDEPADLAGTRAAADPVLDAYRTPPPAVPPELGDLALLWANLADTHAGELLALRDQLLQIRYDDSPDAPPGHSYGALLRMLTGEPPEREGYAEQFAAAYALLARERGFATRVVVGYLLPEQGADGSYTVTEAQAHAWPEVNLTGRGWVAVEPTDLSRIGAPHDPGDDAAEPPTESPGPDGEQVEAREPRVVVDEAARSTGGGERLREGAAVGGLVAFGVLALLPVVSVVAKARRRRRRRRAGRPADRVVGAWDETVDRLSEHGVDVGAAYTSSEVAARATARFNGSLTAVGPLASLVAVAVYSPVEPSEEAARRAWELEHAARGELDAVGGARQWLRSRIDPRPLVRTWRKR
ncbi:MAG TPA: transglutaminaseTgpA domain-containing protein [Acidimicrobiales bacterium]|nr:transglutaminaseTgpA domain-containing protein [Acidimicrobiales bacterium]